MASSSESENRGLCYIIFENDSQAKISKHPLMASEASSMRRVEIDDGMESCFQRWTFTISYYLKCYA
uniref:Uncharacterized protein n=1 Tax=Tetranychus urticae TaxID=32264 RepID=T1K2S4_TETUR